jgi:hypothetical protein
VAVVKQPRWESNASWDADWGVTLVARIPRLSWALEGVLSGRARAWGVMERQLRSRLAHYPQLTLVGGPIRRTAVRNWWWRELELTQPANGPYVSELAEGQLSIGGSW